MPRLSSPPVFALLTSCLIAAAGCAPDGSDDGARDAAGGDAPDAAGAGGEWRLSVEARTSGTEMLLQAVSPVGGGVVWASGHGGRWARSTDGGLNWTTGVVPGADTLQFRDVEGFDAERAVLLATGPGEMSRLLHTEDGGQSWTLAFVMDHDEGFLDCMAFTDERRGWAYGDPVGGTFYLLETGDGGQSWARVVADRLPAALAGEGGFAASGDCVAPAPEGGVAVATGNGSRPRLLRPDGNGWRAVDLPLTAGPSAGATAVGFGAGGFAWAVGGAIGESIEGARVAVSTDGGERWVATAPPSIDGPLYGGAHIPGVEPPPLVVVGPGGIAWSADGGARWTTVHDSSHWAVAFDETGAGWAVGPRGRITALRLTDGGGR